MKKHTESNDIQNMLNLIYAQNNCILKKMEEILTSDKKITSTEDTKYMKEVIDIGEKMNNHLKENKLTYKQHYVLKYHLANDYVSDTYLSESTGVSYSSISQWKHKNPLFRELYDKIKTFK